MMRISSLLNPSEEDDKRSTMATSYNPIQEHKPAVVGANWQGNYNQRFERIYKDRKLCFQFQR
jgi:hypothetical protein